MADFHLHHTDKVNFNSIDYSFNLVFLNFFTAIIPPAVVNSELILEFKEKVNLFNNLFASQYTFFKILAFHEL